MENILYLNDNQQPEIKSKALNACQKNRESNLDTNSYYTSKKLVLNEFQLKLRDNRISLCI